MEGFLLTSRKGFEPPTVRLEGACSIQLSYRDIGMYQRQRYLLYLIPDFFQALTLKVLNFIIKLRLFHLTISEFAHAENPLQAGFRTPQSMHT